MAGACTQGPEGWALTGRVTNSASGGRGYSIVVDFVATPGDTVVATRLATVPTVRPRASASWRVTGPGATEKNLACVIRQVLSRS